MTSSNPTSPASADAKPEGRGGKVVALLVAGLVVLFGGLYVAAYAIAGDKLPEGATVGDVEVGGKTPEDASDLLRREFEGRTTVEATVDGRPATLTVQQLGLSLDVDATVEKAGGGRSWSPAKLWEHFVGGDEVEPVLAWDATAFEATMTALDKQFGKAATEGDVAFQGSTVQRVAAADGLAIDRDAAETAIKQAYVGGGTAELDLVVDQPDITNDEVQAALDSFGNPAVSGPVTLDFSGKKVTLQPADYTAAIDLAPKDGTLQPVLDPAKLDGVLAEHLADRADKPVDATVKLVNGAPTVVPSKPGVDYLPADLTSTFLATAVKPDGQRSGTVKATVKEPEFTTAEAQALKIVEKVGSFTTYYPHANYRNVNLGRASELIDGTLLKPGETFSLNDTVGERTAANGFTDGYIISNGILREELGGGVSQMATTLFNAMFFAGLEDVEHKPHSFYIDRYPVGREATVAWGSLDLRFKNDSQYGVLVDTAVRPSTSGSRGSVTVTLWSTERYEIDSITGNRYNHRAPKTRVLWDDPRCENHTGWSGFDIDVWRVFKDPTTGKELKREKFHTSYTASDHVQCRTTPKPAPTPSPTPSPAPSPQPGG